MNADKQRENQALALNKVVRLRHCLLTWVQGTVLGNKIASAL